MKKALLPIILPIMFLINLNAQNYFPGKSDNPNWKVYRTFYSSSGMTFGIIDYYYGELVEYCDKEYIEIIEDWQDEYQVKLGYVRIEGQRVYVLSDTNCIYEAVLYDFNLNEQDSITCGYNMNLNNNNYNLFTVNSVDEIEQYTIQRKVQEMKYNRYPNEEYSSTTMNWIEGVGSSKNPFYSLSCIGDFCEVEDTLWQVFLNEEIVYDNFTVHTDQLQIDDDLIKVYPTVFDQYFNIESYGENDYQIKLFDTSGKCKLEKIIGSKEGEIYVSDISSGIYFLEIVNLKSGRMKIEKVIKR